MDKLAFVFLVLLCCEGIRGQAFQSCKIVDSNTNLRLYWDLTTPGKIRFLVQGETAGWLGLGLSNGGAHPMVSNGNMSDIWVGWVDPSSSACANGCLYDYWTSQYRQPSLDPQQSLTLVSATFAEGVTSLEFYRDLNTYDQYDRAIQIDEPTTFIWAMNPSSDATPTPDGTSFMKHNADTKGVITITLSAPSQCKVAPPPTAHSYSNDDGSFNVRWNILENKTIKFTVTAKTKGWVGLGFGTSPTMIGSDVYVAWLGPNGDAVVSDRYITEYSMPEKDTALGGNDDIIHAESDADGDNGVTSVTFSRPIDTKDKRDVNLAQGKLYMVWAYGDDSSVNYATGEFYKHLEKGVVQVDLMNGTISGVSTVDLYRIHGIVMVVSVCLLFFPGMLIARYFKIIIPKWFHLHALLQTMGMVGVICAFTIVFEANNKMFVVGVHQIFGLIAICGFGLQFLIGLASHFKFDPKRSAPPVFPDQTHWWLGRGAFAWSLVTIYLGMKTIGAPAAAVSLYFVWLGIAIAGVLLLQHMVGQTHEKPQEYLVMEMQDRESGPIEPEEEIEKAETESEYPRGYLSRPMIVLYVMMAISIGVLLTAVLYGSDSDIIANSGNDSGLPSGNTGGLTDPYQSQVTYQFDNFVVPNESTNYICRGFKLLSDQDYHIIEFDPILDNQLMLHHMILYETANYTGDDYFDCSSMPKGSSPLYTWAVGGIRYELPSHVGFRIGKTAGKYVALQIHFDNPNQYSGRTDSSGVTLTLTSLLRPIDAGYFITGTSVKDILIPPGMPYFEINGYCDPAPLLTKNKANATEYTIFRAGPHMHTMGRQIWTDHFRPDPVTKELVNIGTVGCDDFYSFNDQKGQPVNITFRPGDQFITHCIYDSTSKTVYTKGCESTQCEMCLNYIIYYPKISPSALSCGGRPVISNNTVSNLHCN